MGDTMKCSQREEGVGRGESMTDAGSPGVESLSYMMMCAANQSNRAGKRRTEGDDTQTLWKTMTMVRKATVERIGWKKGKWQKMQCGVPGRSIKCPNSASPYAE